MTEPKLLFGNTSTQIYKDEITNNFILTNNLNVTDKTDILILTQDENVGIKNNNPVYDLDVNGNINTNGNYKINGNDVILQNSLASGVTSSNLQELGTLNNLNITGNLNTTSISVLNNAEIDGNLNISGNLTVNGTFTTNDTVLTNVTQNFIELSTSNTTNSLDSGFYSMYIDGGITKYKGIFNDASDDNKFKFFKELEEKPLQQVNINHLSFELGDMEINNLYGNNINISSKLTSESINVTDITILNDIDINNNLNVSGDINIYNANLFSSNNKIGINTTQPSYLLDVSGIINSKEYKLNGNSLFSNNSINNGITGSNLQTLGILESVTVSGNSYLNGNNYLDRATIKNDLRISGNLGLQIVPNSNYRINSNGDINTNTNYRVNGNIVLNENTLGNTITESNLKKLGVINNLNITESGYIKIGLDNLTNSNNKIDITSGDINIDNNSNYKINNEIVLSNNNLGLSITNSNLKNFGIIDEINISGIANINNLTVDNSVKYGTNFNNNSLNISESIGIYNTTETSQLDFIFNKTTFNNGTQEQKMASLNFKTDIGGFISDNNPENTLTEYASIEVKSKNIMNDNDKGSEFVFKNTEMHTINSREVMRIKNDGNVNILGNYQINNDDVLTSNSLGNGITSSHLQKLGILNELNVNNKINISNSINITSDLYVDGEFYNKDGGRYEFSNLSINNSEDIYNLNNNFALGISTPEEKLHIEEGNIYLNTTIANNYTNGIIKFNKHGEHDAIYFGEELSNGTKISIDEAGSCINIKNGGSGFDNTLENINDRSGKFKLSNYNKNSGEYETNFYMDTTGNIGINTTNPATKLHISSTDGLILPVGNISERINITGAIRYNSDTSSVEYYNGNEWSLNNVIKDFDGDTYISVENNSGSDNDELKFYTNGIEQMIIDSNGDIGISGAVQINALNVTGNITTNDNFIGLDVNSTDNTKYSGFYTTYDKGSGKRYAGLYRDKNNDYFYFFNNQSNIPSGSSNPLNDYGNIVVGTIQTANDIIVNGNVGIGTNNPSEKLDVNGNAEIGPTDNESMVIGNMGYSGWSGIANKNFASAGNYALLQNGTSGQTYLNTPSGQDIVFRENNATRMTIKTGGNVGIGTDNPTNGKLEIVGSDGSVSLNAYNYNKIDSDKVKLGKTNVTNSYSIYADGKIAASEFNAISDKRIKTNIINQDIKKDIDFINNVNIYKYNFIDKITNGSNEKIGFIAQEIEELNSNIINYSKKYIPNIYKHYNLLSDNKFSLDDDNIKLDINDNLKIQIFNINSNKYLFIETKIIEIDQNIYTFDNKNINIDISKGIFIYGKLIDDFLTIDTNQILAINTNMIKFLYNKIIDNDINYKNDINNILKRLEKIEKNN